MFSNLQRLNTVRTALINQEKVQSASEKREEGKTPPAPIAQNGTPPTSFDQRQRTSSVAEGERVTAGSRYRYSQALHEIMDSLEPLSIMSATIYLMSYERMKQLKVCDVMIPAFEKGKDALEGSISYSKENKRYMSVNDARMGAVGNANKCQKCGLLNCAGHYGLITFGDPEKDIWWEVYSPLFIRDIIRVLNCVCHSCSGLLELKANIEDSEIARLKGWNRLKALEEHSKKISCSRKPTPTIAYLSVIEGKYRLLLISPDGRTQIIQSPENLEDKAALAIMALERLSAAVSGELVVHVNVSRVLQNPLPKYRSSLNKLKERKSLKLDEVDEKDEFIQRLKAAKPEEIITTQTIDSGICGPIAGCSQKREYLPAKARDSNAIVFKTKEGTTVTMSISEVYEILNCISDANARLLGFGPDSHPRDFILKGILVLPLTMRPPRKLNGTLTPHALTLAYEKIVSINAKIKNNRTEFLSIEDKLNLLEQRHLIDTDLIERRDDLQTEFKDLHTELSSKVKALLLGGEMKSSFPEEVVSILDIIQGKQGTIRNAMMGKRGDFCGRTVITPDPMIKYGEIGLPMAARIMTVKEPVNSINLKYVERLMMQGEITSIKTKGKPYNVNPRVITKADWNTYKPQIGDTVFRKMRDGDYILVNRQPTLRRHSMLAFRVRFLPGFSIRLHPDSAQSFNADFDGDEMNLWGLQDFTAIAEAQYVMNSIYCTMNAEKVGPMVGLIQDLVTSAFLMTSDNKVYDEATFLQIIGQASEMEALSDFFARLRRYGVNPYSGKAMFSALLPPDFYYQNGPVLIVDGVLLRGIITSHDVGAVPRSIIHQLIFQYSEERMSRFLTDATYMLSYYITDVRGFTVSFDDCLASPELQRLTDQLINEVRIKVELLQSELNGDPMQEEYIEEQVTGLLLSAAGKATALAKEELVNDNNLGVMSSEIGGGGKGKPFNTSHMIVALMQQFYKDERIRKTMTGGTRCSPSFSPEDRSLESRGFCVNSFSKGLSPNEMVMQGVSARPDIINISVEVSNTGHVMRQIEKFMEDLRVVYDGTVRNSAGFVFQFVYGDGGLDSNKCIQVSSSRTKNLASFTDPALVATKLNIAQGWIPEFILGDELPVGKLPPRKEGQKMAEIWRYESWAQLKLEDEGVEAFRKQLLELHRSLSIRRMDNMGKNVFMHRFLSEQESPDSPYYHLIERWINSHLPLAQRDITMKGILPQSSRDRIVIVLEKRRRGRLQDSDPLTDVVSIISKWDPDASELLSRWEQGQVIPDTDSKYIISLLSQKRALSEEEKVYIANILINWNEEDVTPELETWLEGGPEPLVLHQWRIGQTKTQLDSLALRDLLAIWEKGLATPEIEAESIGMFFNYWHEHVQMVKPGRSGAFTIILDQEEKLTQRIRTALSNWATRYGISQFKVQEFIDYWIKERYTPQTLFRPREINGESYASPFEKWAKVNLEAWSIERSVNKEYAKQLLSEAVQTLISEWKLISFQSILEAWSKREDIPDYKIQAFNTLIGEKGYTTEDLADIGRSPFLPWARSNLQASEQSLMNLLKQWNRIA